MGNWDFERLTPDSTMQRAIASKISALYVNIDLTIPAQRDVANEVRTELGLTELTPIGSLEARE